MKVVVMILSFVVIALTIDTDNAETEGGDLANQVKISFET